MVDFFYRHVFYFGEFVCDKWNVAGVAGLAAEGDGRHVWGVGLQEQLCERNDGGGIAHVLCVVERYDSGKADENVGIKGEELFDKFGRAGETMNVDVATMEARGAEYGEGVFVGFAEMQYERLSAVDAELQMALEKLDLCIFCFGSVMVVESEFSAGNALGVF